MDIYPKSEERDYAGVCIKCYKQGPTCIIDLNRNGAIIRPDNIPDDDEIHDYREVTQCCHSEDFIPKYYATKCITCGEWIDMRFGIRIPGKDLYECEACNREKENTISLDMSSLFNTEHGSKEDRQPLGS